MTFLQLYGDQLDRQLGTADRTNLFTTARRKAAINEAQLWFLIETECFQTTASIAVVDGTAEYDLEVASTSFLALSKDGPELWLDPGGGGTIQYLSGNDFQRTTIERMNREEPGWRNGTGTPDRWYETEDGGEALIGLVATPDIPAGATWTLKVPYLIRPADMVLDADVPFTLTSNALRRMEPWHDALGLYAASELEKLRKDWDQSRLLRTKAEERVLDYDDKQRAPGGKVVTVVRSYRKDARRHGSGLATWENRWDSPYK